MTLSAAEGPAKPRTPWGIAEAWIEKKKERKRIPKDLVGSRINQIYKPEQFDTKLSETGNHKLVRCHIFDNHAQPIRKKDMNLKPGETKRLSVHFSTSPVEENDVQVMDGSMVITMSREKAAEYGQTSGEIVVEANKEGEVVIKEVINDEPFLYKILGMLWKLIDMIMRALLFPIKCLKGERNNS